MYNLFLKHYPTLFLLGSLLCASVNKQNVSFYLIITISSCIKVYIFFCIDNLYFLIKKAHFLYLPRAPVDLRTALVIHFVFSSFLPRWFRTKILLCKIFYSLYDIYSLAKKSRVPIIIIHALPLYQACLFQ